jgi:2-keto-3-deoxy-L-rhamnonate aldolase RhmA
MDQSGKNWVKEALASHRKIAAAWAQAGSNITAEILGDAGFDAVMIDLEHGPGDIMTLISQIQALKGNPAVPFVRAPWNDFVQIKRILDAGTYGLLVPYVNSRAEAEEAVKAARYPVAGIRGVAGSPRAPGYGKNTKAYLESADSEIVLMTAVETPEAVGNIKDIVSVDGVDGIFIGPMDLATSMGHLGNPAHPEVKDAIGKVESAVAGTGKFLATVAGGWDDAKAKYDRGYDFLLLMSDTVSLGKLARSVMDDFIKQYR